MNSPVPVSSVSVIVCTRDRPVQLEQALRAILASQSTAAFELAVVDQSADDEAAGVVEGLRQADTRVRLIRDHGHGLSRARNIGLAATRGDIIVFTDDDCEPAADWLQVLVDSLRSDAGAGIAFGSVVPAACDPAEGFIVGYMPSGPRRLSGRLGKLRDGGIGANMAMRRSVLVQIGGFDELLGAGGYFASCEDGDAAYRVLAAGYALLHVPNARVIHYGLRDWKSGSSLARRTYVAVAATYMKSLRLGDLVGGLLLIQQLGSAIGTIFGAAIHLRRPLGVGRLAALCVGIWRSFELDVEPATRMYARR